MFYYCKKCLVDVCGYYSDLKDWYMEIQNAKLRCSRCRCTPLVDAIQSHAPDDDILKLLAAYEDAAKTKDKYGALPLNLAIKYKLSNKVILTLLAANKDAIKTEDDCNKNRFYPLCEAIEAKYSDEVILAILSEDKQATTKKSTRYRLLSLLLAIKCGCSDEVILSLLAANKDAAKIPDNISYLPLHQAIEYKISDKVILALLNANAEAAKMKDKNKVLPLHKAIASNCSENVILKIFSAYPCAAMIRCKKTELLPLHLAAASSLSPVFIEALIREYPEALDTLANHSYPKDLVTSDLPQESIKMICRPYSEWNKIVSAVASSNKRSSEKLNDVMKLTEAVTKLSGVLMTFHKTLSTLTEKIHDIQTDLMHPDTCYDSKSDKVESVDMLLHAEKVMLYVDDGISTREKKLQKNTDSVDFENKAVLLENKRWDGTRESSSNSGMDQVMIASKFQIASQANIQNFDLKDRNHRAFDLTSSVGETKFTNEDPKALPEGKHVVMSDSWQCHSLFSEPSVESLCSSNNFNSFVFIGENLIEGTQATITADKEANLDDSSLDNSTLSNENEPILPISLSGIIH
jgi:hypothetical protein